MTIRESEESDRDVSQVVETVVTKSSGIDAKPFGHHVEVVGSEIDWDVVVSFSSDREREELLRAVGDVIRKANVRHHFSFYSSRPEEDLEYYLDGLDLVDLDPEVRAFALLLGLDRLNSHAGDLAKNLLLAQSHVEYWRQNPLISNDDRLMYLDPLRAQWGRQMWKILVNTVLSKSILTYCEDKEYRDFLQFLACFLEIFRAEKRSGRRIGELVESSKKLGSDVTYCSTFIDFPIEFPEFREYVKELTLEELVFLRASVEWDNPTVKSSVKICEGMLRGSRLSESVPVLRSTLEAIDSAVTGPLEKLTVREYTRLCEENSVRVESLALLENYFLNVEEKVSVVEVYKTVRTVFGLTHVWAEHYSAADYIVGELFSVSGSSKVTLDVLREVTLHGLRPSLQEWETLFENWAVVKDVSPVLAFAVFGVE